MNVIMLTCPTGKMLGKGFDLGSTVSGNPNYEDLDKPDLLEELVPGSPTVESTVGTLRDVFSLEYKMDRKLLVNTSGRLHYYLITLRVFWGGRNVAEEIRRSIGLTSRLSDVLLPEYGSSECTMSNPYGTYHSHTSLVRLDPNFGFYPVARVKYTCNLDKYDLMIRLVE